ncbi:MAG: diguanylate cyclase [FCB group bacterium]|nr:diguanylate cyclase [FCB group bacterium]
MIACIPINGNSGLEDTLSEHFGSAPYFGMYNTESDEFSVIGNNNAHHQHGTCQPMSILADRHVDMIICTGIGRRAIQALNQGGIKVYKSEAGKVGEVIEKIKSGKLVELDPAMACQGHGHGPSGCAHGHGNGPKNQR